MSDLVQVNFGRPMPLFPLQDVVLLPHAVLPLRIFEPRYRQMVRACLDGAGQIAMACVDPRSMAGDLEPVPLKPVVCIGQIIEHEAPLDGRYDILLHGVCRARIVELHEPTGDRLYRMADLRPIERIDLDAPPMPGVRNRLRRLLGRDRLQRMDCVRSVLKWFEHDDVSTHALLELVGFTVIHDPRTRYDLLAEADAHARARLIERELVGLDRMLSMAETQSQDRWPKGVSWN